MKLTGWDPPIRKQLLGWNPPISKSKREKVKKKRKREREIDPDNPPFVVRRSSPRERDRRRCWSSSPSCPLRLHCRQRKKRERDRRQSRSLREIAVGGACRRVAPLCLRCRQRKEEERSSVRRSLARQPLFAVDLQLVKVLVLQKLT